MYLCNVINKQHDRHGGFREKNKKQKNEKVYC
nr:MAG TPA: hypothetical protein [Caudoviricetes sp.]